jgi:hypothetical protein
MNFGDHEINEELNGIKDETLRSGAACAHRTFQMVALTCSAHLHRLGRSDSMEIVIGSRTRL